MRLIRILIALACLALGAVVGALNRQPVSIDVGFVYLPSNLGIALIISLLVGVLVGGLAISASLVLPLRRRLARVERVQSAVPAVPTGN
ncbi:hypothetical protein N792_08430 [Lysobacter concretionis Ko07 = DSM 16239]|uniref:Lipopolysaccharide assembly protein A domain-containing protein n=1 Tax=Lysobacter concretionis Ko07 = DSM 16239 TaxID=1122185 RepID=A0A0A0EMQ9_9GAMM|nr:MULTISPECIES: lipopolysaccharide assembly protein LapA domain-containing protein [Lysobacter]KGM51694.1 hypothetical protein N792_08430 [Lysobacter concretionis Ko07 = DSM 16239]QOD92242.1 DUF1049 domain-containing protein [Lysobacter sp. CW239]